MSFYWIFILYNLVVGWCIVTLNGVPTLLKDKICEWKYHSYEEMTHFLKKANSEHPKLTRLYSIGSSVLNKSLWVLEITAAPQEKIGVPNIKLIGNIHANEQLGKEIILMLVKFLLSEYETSRRVQWLMNNTRIHLLPCLNPDGLQNDMAGCDNLPGNVRNNVRDVDLNTDFPDLYEKLAQPHQEETKAVMKWLQDVPFILSASLHTSALVVTYPFDSKPHNTWDTAYQLLKKSNGQHDIKTIWQQVANVSEGPSLTPDDDIFRHLASTYATNHPTMHKSITCPKIFKIFRNGSINGAEWHSKSGTMQDFNYFAHGCMELTLVLSCCRHPPSNELLKYWSDNREPLLRFVSQVHMGVQGFISDAHTNKYITGVQLQIVGRNVTFYSSSNGEYWRILLPGKYYLLAQNNGYHIAITEIEVILNPEDYLQMIMVNISMLPCNGRTYRNESLQLTRHNTKYLACIYVNRSVNWDTIPFNEELLNPKNTAVQNYGSFLMQIILSTKLLFSISSIFF